MNAAQRQLLLFGSLMTVLLARYFNPFLDSISQGFQAVRNRVESPNDVRMRVFCPRTSLKKPFCVAVYIKSPYREQTATLNLPPGMTLAAGQQVEQCVPPPGENGYSQVIWRVRVWTAGEYEVQAVAPGIGKTTEWIRVDEPFG